MAGLLSVLYLQFYIPYQKLKLATRPLPIEAGERFGFVLEETERQKEVTIGRLQGNIVTRIKGLQEAHVIITFKRIRETENYTITITKKGPVLLNPPRTDHFSKLESKHVFDSHEIIGNQCEIRISDVFQKDRMLHYIEFVITAEFFVGKTGRERLKFWVTVSKIHPGLNLENPTKDNLYLWGQVQKTEDE